MVFNLSEVRELSYELEANEEIRDQFKNKGGWTTLVVNILDKEKKNIIDYKTLIYREDGRFYAIEPGLYGNPMLLDEPVKKIDISELTNCIDINGDKTTPRAALTGILIPEANIRTSLSNEKVFSKLKFVDGTSNTEVIVTVDGKEKHFFLNLLEDKDKNRVHGYVGFFTSTKQENIKILELEDITKNLIDLESKNEKYEKKCNKLREEIKKLLAENIELKEKIKTLE